MENVELTLNQNQTKENELATEKEQTNFLETGMGKAVNFAMDVGLRALLPNFIEDSVIEIKDTIFREGFGEGLKSVINSGINFGKSVVGVFTGKFDNINQMQTAVQKGGIIDGTSKLLDTVLNKVQKKKLIPKEAITAIKQGKNLLLDNVSKNIENTLTRQVKEIENLENYANKWQEYYDKKDFTNMDKQFKKMETSLNNIMPLESTIKRAREIENIHNLIKNNGKDFNLSIDQIELAKKLVS